tara:strand:- start:208 stop:384 length:177 start_codon:yes stop_codon:yes gene_type:complete
MLSLRNVWSIWCKTIGSKITDDNRENDIAATIRTIWVITHMVACFFIILHNGIKIGWF